MKKKIILAMALMFCVLGGVSKAQVIPMEKRIMTWKAVTTQEDGTDENIKGYKVCLKHMKECIDVGNVTRHEMDLPLNGATYCFTVIAYDVAGNESESSEEACKTVADKVKPRKVTGCSWINL